MSAGKATISNDGATILKLLDVVHPAAKTLVDIARSQDAEVRINVTPEFENDSGRQEMFKLIYFFPPSCPSRLAMAPPL